VSLIQQVSDEAAAQTIPTERSSSPGAVAILPLTGVRGFAAIWVVLYHLRGGLEQALPTWTGLHAVVGAGYLGVDLFAFLSGFVISHTYGDRLDRFSMGSTARYLWLRLARIYPLHLFVLLLFVVGFTWFRGFGSLPLVFDDGRFWRQLFLLNGWGLESRFGWNVPSWTVSSEWFCYLCFALVAPLLARVQRGELAAALAIWTFGLTAYLMNAVGHPAFDAFLDWGLVRIGGEFLVGCCLNRAYRAGWGRSMRWSWIGALALAGGIGFSKLLPAASVGCFAILVYALALDRQPLKTIFGNPAVVWLGEISYSIYMIHWFVLTQGLALMGPRARDLSPGLLVGILFALVLAGSALTYTFVENPSRRWLRRRPWVRRSDTTAAGQR
jgi:peptidoglycan/LPS O-acetylase OafA/YrhL